LALIRIYIYKMYDGPSASAEDHFNRAQFRPAM